MTKQTTKRSEILMALRFANAKGVTNVELSKIALRYGGYLGKLYELGYVIEKESLGNGVYNYVLVEEPTEEVTSFTSAYELLVSAVEQRGSIDSTQLAEFINGLGLQVKYKAGTHQLLAKTVNA